MTIFCLFHLKRNLVGLLVCLLLLVFLLWNCLLGGDGGFFLGGVVVGCLLCVHALKTGLCRERKEKKKNRKVESDFGRGALPCLAFRVDVFQKGKNK
jgi:hypothetical protein